MTADSLRPILEHRLLIVTGKGGTGKTTVSAALALAASRQGKKVALAELGHGEQLPQLFAENPPQVGYEGRELQPGLTVMRIDPFDALADYLGLQLGMRAPINAVLRNRAFRQFLEATPGWRELICLGKVWHLEQLTEPSGKATYDLIVVDAPATGHGLTFLDVPRVVASAVSTGPLQRNALAVGELIRDASRTLLVPVALPEELPARETAELASRLREDLGVAVDRVVVNGIAPSPFPDGLEDLDERIARLDPDRTTTLRALPRPDVLAACASLLASRFALNQRYVKEIAEETALPVVPLPYLDGGLDGIGDLELLAQLLVAQIDPARHLDSAAELSARRRHSEAA